VTSAVPLPRLLELLAGVEERGVAVGSSRTVTVFGMSLQCPRCARGLLLAEGLPGILAGCEGCGALWVDNAVGAALLAGEEAGRVQAFAEAFDRVSDPEGQGPAYRARQAPSARTPACPVCATALQATVLEGDVEVDLCLDHGTLFDRHELRSFKFARAKKEAAEAAQVARYHAKTQAELESFGADLRAPSEEHRRRYPLTAGLLDLLHLISSQR